MTNLAWGKETAKAASPMNPLLNEVEQEELDRVGTLKSRQAEISETEFSNESGEFFPLHFTHFQ